MREMRRSDRMITDREEIVDVLDSCKVFRMAVHDEEGMYIVPLNFGYTYEEDVLKLYFHSAGEGRKVDALAADPKVAIEMDTDHYLVEGQKCLQLWLSLQQYHGKWHSQKADRS